MKKVQYICDIHECGNPANLQGKLMHVLFTTEQNEGRSVDPYIQEQELDLCDSCISAVLKSGQYIRAAGAMGHNCYRLGSSDSGYYKYLEELCSLSGDVFQLTLAREVCEDGIDVLYVELNNDDGLFGDPTVRLYDYGADNFKSAFVGLIDRIKEDVKRLRGAK